MNNNQLFNKGFIKKKISNINLKKISLIKKKIENFSKKKLKIKKNFSLKEIHNLFDQSDFNSFRLDVIKKINGISNLNQILFEVFKTDLIDIFGPDISGQKNINLAIQRPQDIDRPQLHRDSPPGSKFEIVIWVPLVDCKKSMNMVFFPIKKTKFVKNVLLKKNVNQSNLAQKYGHKIKNVKYGEYLIFLSKIYHYIPINFEKNTRWSLNFRYKNTFTPYGKKGYLDYFEPINYSKITNAAIDESK